MPLVVPSPKVRPVVKVKAPGPPFPGAITPPLLTTTPPVELMMPVPYKVPPPVPKDSGVVRGVSEL